MYRTDRFMNACIFKKKKKHVKRFGKRIDLYTASQHLFLCIDVDFILME